MHDLFSFLLNKYLETEPLNEFERARAERFVAFARNWLAEHPPIPLHDSEFAGPAFAFTDFPALPLSIQSTPQFLPTASTAKVFGGDYATPPGPSQSIPFFNNR